MSTTFHPGAWLPRQTAGGSGLRLFCFPHAGSGASMYYPWIRELGPGIDVQPVQYPGREDRFSEPASWHLQPLVEQFTEALEPLVQQPFALFGNSMGALFAFEVARSVRRRYGVLPAQLFVSAFPAPQQKRRLEVLHELPDEEFLQKLRERYNHVAHSLLNNQELVQVLLPVIRADVALVETYSYQAEDPLDCPITAAGGRDDAAVTMSDLSGWREQTTRAFSLRLLPGDHFYIEPSREQVLRLIEHRLQPYVTSR